MAKTGGTSYNYEKFSITRGLLCEFKISKNGKNICRFKKKLTCKAVLHMWKFFIIVVFAQTLVQ